MKDVFNRSLVSKICHDLIAHTSAIANGFELIKDTYTQESGNGEIINLIEQSVNALNSKLVMLRACYGRNAVHILNEETSFKKIITNFLQTYKINIEKISHTQMLDENILLVLSNIIVVIANIALPNNNLSIEMTQNNCTIYIEGDFYDKNLDMFLKAIDSKNENINMENNDSKMISFFILQQIVQKFAKNKIFTKQQFSDENKCTSILIKIGI